MNNRPLTSLRGKIHVKHGFAFKGEHFKSSGTYVVLTPGNFHERGGFKRNEQKDKCYDESFPEEYLMKKGDILVAMTEQTDGLLGSMAIVPESNRFLHNQRLGLVTALTNEVDTEFIYHLFKTRSVREQLRLSASGSKVKHTSPDRIYDVQAPLPSRREQNAIANLLSTLDAKIELNHRINAELEGMAKLLYDYWFVQFDFPMSAAQAAAIAKPQLAGQPYQSSGGKMTHHPDLKREIPEGWTVGSLNCLGEIMGGTTPSTKEIHYFTTEGTPWITPKDMSRNTQNKFISRGETDVTEAGIKSASLSILPAGTVLMSSRAPIGYTAIARNPVTTNQGFKSFVPSKGYSTEFIYYTLNHMMQVIEQNASGSTFKEVSGGTLKAIQTQLPEPNVRAEFSKILQPIFAQQDTLEQQNQHLTALRDWLLPMLMNGQVTVG